MDGNEIVICYSYWDTTLIAVGILWTCLCRSRCIASCFEVLPMLTSRRILAWVMEVLMLTDKMKYMWDIAEEDQKQKIVGLLKKKYAIAEDWQGRQRYQTKKEQKLR